MSAIRKNLVWLLISQAASWAITLVTAILVPRYLGDEDLGMLATAVAFVGFFTLVAGLGTSTLMTREVARDHAVVGPYVYNALVFKLLLVAVFSAVALSVARAFGMTGGTFVLIAVGCVGMLFIVTGEVLHSALAGMERMAKPAMWSVVQVYLANIVGLLVLALGGGVVAYGSILVLGNLIPTIAMAVMLRPLIRGHGHIDFTTWRWLVRAGLPLTALAFSNLVYGTVDIPILSLIAGDDDVGWYSLAQRWIGIPVFISTAVMAAFYPSFSSLAKTMSTQFAVQVNKAVLLVLLASVPAAVGLGVIAEDLVHFLYQPQFDNSIVLMQILAFHIPLTAMDTILAMALIAAYRQNRYIVVAFTAAVLNPIACLIAIPATERAYGNGAIGAAIVTVGTELFIMCAALALRSPGVLDRATTFKCLRIIAAGLVMGVLVLVAGDLPLGVQIAIGIVAYAGASVAFRTVSVADLRLVLPQGLATVGSARPTTNDDERSDDGRSGDRGADHEPDLRGDLYAQPGGQDREGGRERPGE